MNFDYEKILDRYKSWGFPQKGGLNLPSSFRVNIMQAKPKEVIGRLKDQRVFIEKVDFVRNCYHYKSGFPIASSQEYLLGKIYLQETSAQIPGEIIANDIDAKKFDLGRLKILDMCAAPGGKTTQISEILDNRGTVVAVELDKYRCDRMLSNLERMKVKNCIVLNKDANTIGMPNYFDYVLLDAPCSGNYASEAGWLEKRRIVDFTNRQNLQKELLKSAVNMTKDNGIIIYSTCSLEIEENEDIVEYGIKEFGLELQECGINFGEKGLTKDTEKCLRVWPTQQSAPGFFVAKLLKKRDVPKEEKANKEEEKIVRGNLY